MRLPNPDRALVPRAKIEGYLLSPARLVGRHKEVFFRSLGYTQGEWRVLERDIQGFASRDALPTKATRYGQKYEVRGALTGPNGRAASIVTAWIVRGDEDFPRLLTAYPED
jgi:hypothetical protein